MLLMLKNVCVLKFNTDELICQVYEEGLLPFQLKERIFTIDVHKLNIVTALRKFAGMRSLLLDYLAGRVLPLSRSNADKIYSLITDDKTQTQENLARISRMCHSVSLLDNYWVKEDYETLGWKDVSIRHNTLNEIFTRAALRGELLSLQGTMYSPEVSTHGIYTKGWKREEGYLWLYKKMGRRSEIEIIVSNILDNTDVNHVQYFAAKDNNDFCCKCECVTSDDVSMVDANTMIRYIDRQGSDFQQYILRNFSQDFYKMCIADYLIGNIDRHGHNWGVLYDADTTDVIGLHPLLDHDQAFGRLYMKTANVQYKAYPGKTLEEAAMEASKHIDFIQYNGFRKEDFPSESYYVEFMNRLHKLKV